MSSGPPKAVVYRRFEGQGKACEQALRILLQKRAVTRPPQMPERSLMKQTKQLNPNSSKGLFIHFDLRCPGARERLYLVCDSFGDYAHIEYVDAAHAVLVIRPGGALGARW